jgi:protein gp37
VTVHEDRLDEPLTFEYPDGPGRVFVCSMSDLFHPQVDSEFIAQIVEVARQLPEQVWIFLTKRPERAAELSLDWPANAWVGTSVGSGPGGRFPDMSHRIDHLRDIDAETRWVSFEPLIDPVGGLMGPYPDLSGIDWAVVGGESEPDDDARREMREEWARAIYEAARAQDVPFFYKQSSAKRPETGTRLTVEHERYGVFEQRRIRESPDPPTMTQTARSQPD